MKLPVEKAPDRWLSLTITFGAIALLLAYLGWQQGRSAAPEFTDFPAGDARKSAFFDYLTPLINRENARLLKDREHLAEVERRLQNPLTRKLELRWLKSLALDYGEPVTEDSAESATHLVRNLLLKVDQIPNVTRPGPGRQGIRLGDIPLRQRRQQLLRPALLQ
jgi:uncharacterized FlgJ-related protein